MGTSSMKLILLMMIIIKTFIITNSFAFPISNPPTNCFDNEVYCATTSISTNADNLYVIHVSFFAKLEKEDYQSLQEIIDLFFDFAKWPIYASANGENHLVFSLSKELPPIIINQKKIRRQLAKFTTKSPIGRITIKELIHFKDLSPVHDALYKVMFYPDPNFKHKGAKQSGNMSIVFFDGTYKEYLINVNMDTIPELNFLPSLILPYVRNGIISLLRGMLEL